MAGGERREKELLRIADRLSKSRLVAPPRVFVSVASKGVRFPITPLDATLVGSFVSAAFKGVRQGMFCLDLGVGGGRQTGRKERK